MSTPEPAAGGSSEAPPENRRTIGALLAFAFFLLMSYGFARPSVESFFLDAHGSESLPYAWIGVAIAATVVVGIYSRFAGRMELTALFGRAIGIIAILLGVLLAAVHFEVPGSAYLLYLWKDIYIVVLVELFWTIANSHFQLKKARWLYGFFCAAGAVGGLIANKSVGWVAEAVGTAWTPVAVFPLLLACFVATRFMPHTWRDRGDAPKADALAGLRVIKESRYLFLLLAVIATVQVVVTLIDYQFNVTVEAAYPDKDVRTGIIGDVYFYIELVSFVLQVLTGAVLTVLGVSRTLLLIPVVLGGAVIAFLFSPRFLTMAIAKVASKALDYSLFRAAKEMLYLPLNYEERTQGKAVVDILTYRVAKGLTSGLLLAMNALGAPALAATGAALALIGAWIALIVAIIRRYTRRMEESET